MAEIVNSAPQNNAKAHVPKHHSNFPIRFDFFNTHQFGYYRPHMVLEGISSDDLKYRDVSHTRSYTLKAPLMQDIHRKQSYFKVDYPAILPMNFEKVYQNPTIGDDVTPDVGCCVEDFYKKLRSCFLALHNHVISEWSNNNDAPSLLNFFKYFIFGELFYSRGSLLASLRAELWRQLDYSDASGHFDFDDTFDNFISQFLTQCQGNSIDEFAVVIDGKNYDINLSLSNPPINGSKITFRHFLDLIRGTSDWNWDPNDTNFISAVSNFSFNLRTPYIDCPADAPFNFARVCAYQLALAEFCTNDFVDYIYSAELYRQNIGDLLRDFINSWISASAWPENFTYNGVNYQYDYLSGKYLDVALTYLAASPSLILGNNSYNFALFQYFINIFGLQRSLRYKDYFVGSRTRPLAVGDVNVQVSGGQVSVVDISRKIQVQRYVNAVNHTGRRLGNYIKTFFGIEIKSDRHVPHWVADIDELVYTTEVENTADSQMQDAQSITARFTSNSSNKELTFYVDVPCIIIGVTSYDIERAYTDSVDRNFYIKDRFDMFIPELQFVGDQAVYDAEIRSHSIQPFGSAFAYQYRDMQYKQIHSVAAGAFANNKLPGYSFVSPNFGNLGSLNSDFIRSAPHELDDFYLALTGWSLGNYFHFIVFSKNILNANRPMIANPEILG